MPSVRIEPEGGGYSSAPANSLRQQSLMNLESVRSLDSTKQLVRSDTQFTLKGSINAVKMLAADEKRAEVPWYILHPHSRGVSCWDACTSIALIFTAIVTPFEVSFLAPTTINGPWTLFVLNRLIDAIFIVDMGLQFVIMQQIDIAEGVTNLNSYWETRVHKLGIRYLRMWFWIDLFSVIPSIFDIMPLFESSANPDSSAGRLKALRTVRALRLAKLVRLFRSSRLIERWETRIAVPYNKITMFSLFVGLLYSAHIFSCILALQTTFSTYATETWYSAFGYCDFDLDDPVVDVSLLSDETMKHCNAAPSELYLQCWYWALGVVLGFSPSPLLGPNPQLSIDSRHGRMSNTEEIIFLVLQFWGAILWAYVTARLVDVIVNANPESTRFRQLIDELNRFCAFNKLPKEMEIRLREYYMKRKQITQAESRQAVAEGLSPMLKGEVAWQINAHWLSNIPFLNCDVQGPHSTGKRDPEMQNLRVKVALALQPNVYAPDEIPPDRHLYVIFNGLARYSGSTLVKGDHWGEWDVLLYSPFIRRRRAKAVNYLHVLTLNAVTIEAICVEFPNSYKQIRRWVGWRALSEFLLDTLRRRRRSVMLCGKRWARRRPHIFHKMRLFILTLYRLLKDVPHPRSYDPDFPHRGRLAPDLPAGGGGALAASGVDADLARLHEVNRALQELLVEQQNLTTRIAAAPRMVTAKSKDHVLLPSISRKDVTASVASNGAVGGEQHLSPFRLPPTREI